MSVNNFGLFFTRDGTVIRLPVNPEKLPVARDNDNSEYNVLGIGPIMIPRIPKLREVTISPFSPGGSSLESINGAPSTRLNITSSSLRAP